MYHVMSHISIYFRFGGVYITPLKIKLKREDFLCSEVQKVTRAD